MNDFFGGRKFFLGELKREHHTTLFIKTNKLLLQLPIFFKAKNDRGSVEIAYNFSQLLEKLHVNLKWS